jgi:mutator protein MutT
MTAGALILAGGRGTRMAASTGTDHEKPLVAVRGVSLLERNLCAIVSAGMLDVWVAFRACQRGIGAEVERLAAAVRPRGVTVHALIEAQPLGTIGAAGVVGDRGAPLLAVNADNLCGLDLRSLVDRHLQTGADLTLAAHDHAVTNPYGELDVDGDRVVAYREKPTRVSRVCSAISVLGGAAVRTLDGPAGLPDLTSRLIARGGDVRVLAHTAPWIDVNDAADAARAAALVADHGDTFERWARQPDVEVVGAIVRDGDHILLERRRSGPELGRWDTPGGKIEPGESPAAALRRELREELGLDATAAVAVATFDALEGDGTIVRHHVLALEAAAADVRACEGQVLSWFDCTALPPDRARVVSRSLGWIGGRDASVRRPDHE